MLALGAAAGWGIAQRHGAADPAAAAPGTAAGTPAAAASAGERKVLYWYDPMTPTQKFDKPGKSPFMDMQLVPRYADEPAEDGANGGATGSADAAPSRLNVSATAVQSLGLRLATVERRAVGAAIDAVGIVQLSERDISIVQARTNGFVERVHPYAPGDVIAAGSPLVEVLNPEWLGAQQEFLALKNTGDAALTAAARQRLLLLGMPAELIERVERGGQPIALQTIRAPSGGVLTELAVRNGMTLAAGVTLARINGLGTVWLEVALPEAQAAAVAPGQSAEVHLASRPGERLLGKVAAVLPEANRDTRTLRVRIELANPGQRLKAGMSAQVSLHGDQHEALVVPAEAVIRTGRRALVYLSEQPGRYRPVEVEIGEELGDRLVIRSGLSAGQQVVASSQFLIDSEASMQGVLARAPTAPMAASPAAEQSKPADGPAPAAPAPQARPAAPQAAHQHGAAGTAPPAGATAKPSVAASAAAASTPAAPAAAEHSTRGVIVEFDEDSVTLKHEAVPELKWPPMTMPFLLAKPTLLSGLKAGQTVQFRFTKQDTDFVVTAISAAPAMPAASQTGGRP
ncbi:MAG: efflux RND transporter periplasmic adaptor subunit [Leptothrix sp. (in: b-proteobacteria)]